MDFVKLKRAVKVIDDWHGTYEDGTIKLSLIFNPLHGFVRLCAWGNDDFGLELDFENNDNDELFAIYNAMQIIYYGIADGVDKQFFLNMGMAYS